MSNVANEAEATTPDALEQLVPRAAKVTLDEAGEQRVELSR
jgi:hypothetical protein